LGYALRAASDSSQQLNTNTTPDIVFDNPIGVLGTDTVQRLVGVWIVGLVALVVACAVALFVRYRRANDTEREQIKWLLYACAVFLVVFVGGFVSGLGGTASLGGYIWGVFFGLSVITLPAAIGIAVLRYRLYDIDLLINRTLVYGSLTATLALVYVG
jgi:amino acid permease